MVDNQGTWATDVNAIVLHIILRNILLKYIIITYLLWNQSYEYPSE